MILNLIAYALIPVYTILFVSGSNWFTTNFSVLGNMVGRRELFTLWGLIVGIYFFWCLHRIAARLRRAGADFSRSSGPALGSWLVPASRLVPLSLLLLILGITTPYLPEAFPFQAFLHVVFSFLAAVCLILALFLILFPLYRLRPRRFRGYLLALIFTALFSLFLLWLAGIVSSALEIFFTITVTILVRRLYREICETGQI